MNPVHNEAVPANQREQAATMTELHISVANAIGDVSAAEWDACANPASDSPRSQRCYAFCPGTVRAGWQSNSKVQTSDHVFDYNPFLSHDFLSALEASNSVGARTGWQTSTRAWRERPTAPWSPPLRATSKAIRAANMCSTVAGPKPMSGPAGAIIQNFRWPCRLLRRQDAGSWYGRARWRTRSAARSQRPRPTMPASATHPACT